MLLAQLITETERALLLLLVIALMIIAVMIERAYRLLPQTKPTPRRNPTPDEEFSDLLTIIRQTRTNHQDIYVVGSAAEKIVKIGVSGSPGARIRQLQVSNPHPLLFIVLVRGSTAAERAIKDRFRDLGLGGGGEWFRLDASLTRFITALAALDAADTGPTWNEADL